jgi:hypothetical protein|tara:strand:- start:507 stop:749 length:243 start_codon:yes stop_codon:yes gene_type:complete
MTTRAWIYSNGNQECERASMLLTSIYSDFHEYVLNKEFTESQFRAEFGSEAEYPQIAIGIHHRGSLKETLHYLKDHDLIS